MKKLFRSRFIKFLCFVFSFVLLSGAVFGTVAMAEMPEELLFSRDMTLVKKNVYGLLAERTARIAMDIVAFSGGQSDPDAMEPFVREQYDKMLSPEKCGAVFSVIGADGKTLLSNGSAPGEDGGFTYDFEMSWYPPHFPEETPSVTGAEETTIMPDEYSTYLPPEEETSFVPVRDAVGYSVYYEESPEAFDGSNRTQDAFKYIYESESGIDEDILNYCLDIWRSVNHATGGSPALGMRDIYGSVVFFQNNFRVSVNGTVYPLPDPDTEYLDYASVDSYEDITEPHHGVVDMKEEWVTVRVYVPADPAKTGVRDVYAFAAPIIDFFVGCAQHTLAMTLIMFFAGAVFFLILLCSCGYRRGEEKASAHGLHAVPFDIVIAVFGVGLFCLFYMLMYAEFLEELILPVGILFLFMLLVETVTVRVKSRTLDNFLCIRVFRAVFGADKQARREKRKRVTGGIKNFTRGVSDSVNVLWKLGIAFAAFNIVSLILVAAGDVIGFGGVIVLLIVDIPVAALTVVSAVNFHRLQTAAKKMSRGRLDEKADGRFMFGEFRKNAEYLNAVSSAVDGIVQQGIKNERMKTELITNVSHDLKTPLTSVVNYIDLLKKENIENEKAREYIGVLDRQAQKLKKLTFDVVDASRVSSGNIVVNPEKINLSTLTAQLRGEYEDRLTTAGLTPVVSLPENEISVTADGRLLWRVMENLMSNICKYSLPGTRVYITLARRGNAAEMSMSNISGAPLNISAEELTERFVRGDASRNTEGSGLGLSIASGLISAMGGEMKIRIDGDLFKVTLRLPVTD